MKNKRSITELMSGLDEAYLDGIEPAANDAPPPSAERILALAKQKIGREALLTANRNGGQNDNAQDTGEAPRKQGSVITLMQKQGGGRAKRYPMTKKRMIALVAAIMILTVSVTALAAGLLGGLDFFRSIFGGSADEVEAYIADPRLTAADGERTLTVESLLSDGYQVRMIVSLTSAEGDPSFSLTDGRGALSGYQSYELEEFKENGKRYFSIAAQSAQGLGDAALTVGFEGLSLSVQPENALGTVSAVPDSAHYTSVNFSPRLVRVSPMGVLVIGVEKEMAGGIPAPEVQLLYHDGKSELVLDESYFDQQGDGTSMGGGGMVLPGPGNARMLLEEAHGTRNPSGEVVLAGQFTRIVNLNGVQAILVDGVAYPVS